MRSVRSVANPENEAHSTLRTFAFPGWALSGFGGQKTFVTDELAFPAMPTCCHQGH